MKFQFGGGGPDTQTVQEKVVLHGLWFGAKGFKAHDAMSALVL